MKHIPNAHGHAITHIFGLHLSELDQYLTCIQRKTDTESFVGGGWKEGVSECFGCWCYNCCILHTLLSVCHNAAFNPTKTQTGEELTPSSPQQTDEVRMKRRECWLSASPAALWPRLLGKGDRSIAVWLQGCVTHACPTKTESTTASPVPPTHTHYCHYVLFSHIWYYSLLCQKTMRLQLVCLCTCMSVWEWDKLTLLLTRGWASWTRLWVIECDFYTKGTHRIS